MKKTNIKDKESMSIRLPIKIKHDFRMYCANRNESMNSFFEAAAAKAAREWRIENGQETWDDLNEKTKRELTECFENENLDSLTSYKTVDELFKSMGIEC